MERKGEAAVEERLQKLLSAAGVCSRRRAEAYIQAGRVTVNGKTARLGGKADPGRDRVEVDGVPLAAPAGHTYLMLNKPAGVVSSTDEPGARTVLDLLGEEYQNLGIFPAGRLDKDTEGLLLLTNDGPLAHRLLSPKSHVDKVYYVEVDGALDGDDVLAARAGMVLGDGTICLPADMELLSRNSAHITLREGKYHQVKRMLASRGKPVTYLKRVRFGPLELDESLAKGAYRQLDDGELKGIFSD